MAREERIQVVDQSIVVSRVYLYFDLEYKLKISNE